MSNYNILFMDIIRHIKWHVISLENRAHILEVLGFLRDSLSNINKYFSNSLCPEVQNFNKIKKLKEMFKYNYIRFQQRSNNFLLRTKSDDLQIRLVTLEESRDRVQTMHRELELSIDPMRRELEASKQTFHEISKHWSDLPVDIKRTVF